ncbi:hypothetical protein Tco_0791818 [Tanacetum coccineum]
MRIKAALIKVLKSHKRAIAWKLSDIKGVDIRWILFGPRIQCLRSETKWSRKYSADHHLWIENPHQDEFENKEITETFPLKTLGSVALRDDNTQWFAYFTNYHAENFIVKGISSQQKNKFFKDVNIISGTTPVYSRSVLTKY